ncbi:MAG: hypothetical protein IPI32_08510 [Austwickia sp.]|nr:hypothetical protein [Austwickia sp.]
MTISVVARAEEASLPREHRFRVAVVTDWSLAALPLAALHAFTAIFSADDPVDLVFATPHQPTEEDEQCIGVLSEALEGPAPGSILLEHVEELTHRPAELLISPDSDLSVTVIQVAQFVAGMHRIRQALPTRHAGEQTIGGRRESPRVASRDITVAIPDTSSNVHARAFDEIVETLQSSFTRIGMRPKLVSHEMAAQDAPSVVVAPHLLDPRILETLRPDTTVLYNWEQLIRGGTALVSPTLRAAMSRFTIWDYSSVNVDDWRARGVHAIHVPLGYDPLLERLPELSREPDFDVVHVGSVNKRRMAILEALAARGWRVHAAFGVYGRERDALLARSRLVLNLHFYESALLEIARLSYLWANRKPVVTEIGPTTSDDLGMRDWCLHAPYEALVERVEEALLNPLRTARMTDVAYHRFRQVADASIILQGALEETPVWRASSAQAAPGKGGSG